jgi:DNA-binding transcriptional LysR family regulator
MMASIGLGWSVIPASMVDDSLKIIDLEGVSISRDLGYIFHQERSLSNAARRFIDLLNTQIETSAG